MDLMVALAMPSRAITRQVADKISSRRSSRLTIFGMDMAPATSTWAGKLDLYHSYQALLLPSLPLSPTAAAALAKISAR